MTGAQPDAAVLLETQALARDFGGVHAVAGVDFRLRRGELRCLIGPNGAGKSTFFKMLSGQLRPSAGAVFFAGAEITSLPQHEIARRGIGIKNQVPSVWDGLSVYEHLWVAARRRHRRRHAVEIARELLGRLGLAALADQILATLSHGIRQWVEIGMVIAQEPQLMLLDEPTAGMAADEVDRTIALLRDLNRTSTIIVVEHDLEFIERIASTVTVFNQGRILIEDSMANILADSTVRDVYLGAGHARG